MYICTHVSILTTAFKNGGGRKPIPTYVVKLILDMASTSKIERHLRKLVSRTIFALCLRLNDSVLSVDGYECFEKLFDKEFKPILNGEINPPTVRSYKYRKSFEYRMLERITHDEIREKRLECWQDVLQDSSPGLIFDAFDYIWKTLYVLPKDTFYTMCIEQEIDPRPIRWRRALHHVFRYCVQIGRMKRGIQM